jgi:hypothetical protein
MKPLPAYSFVEPWFMGRCKVAMGDAVFDVVRWEAPIRIVRFTARRNGAVVAERAKFTMLLRDLAALAPAAPTGGS